MSWGSCTSWPVHCCKPTMPRADGEPRQWRDTGRQASSGPCVSPPSNPPSLRPALGVPGRRTRRPARGMRSGTLSARAPRTHTHTPTPNARGARGASVRQSMAWSLTRAPRPLLQEAIDAARANPFRAFVGSVASGAGAGAIVSTDAHAAGTRRNTLFVRARHARVRGQPTHTNVRLGAHARACVCVCMCV